MSRDSSPIRRAAGCAMLVLLQPAWARAEPEAPAAHVEREHEHEHGHEHVIHVGLLGTALGAFVDGEAFYAAGGGLFIEWLAVPGRFELELSARVLGTEGGLEVSQDALAKIPFHVKPWFHPFVGIGPTVAEYWISSEEPDGSRRVGWAIGGAVSVGAHFWMSHRMAIVAEVDYNLLYRFLSAGGVATSGLAHEAGGSAGVLVGF
jgi:hypothetical protein